MSNQRIFFINSCEMCPSHQFDNSFIKEQWGKDWCGELDCEIKEMNVIHENCPLDFAKNYKHLSEINSDGLTDKRLKFAYVHYSGLWPEDLISGVMFYDGLRITKKEFREYEKSLD